MDINSSLETIFAEFTDEELVEDLFRGVIYPDATLDLVIRFAKLLTLGVWGSRVKLDKAISATIPDYDYNRLASIDKNVLRLALYELNEVAYIPPAVTINEAIEIAKKYSTEESGRFVNGVLGNLLKQTPKAHYDAKSAPQDPDMDEVERIINEPIIEPEEETVEADSAEGKLVTRYGVVQPWRTRTSEIEPASIEEPS